MWGASAWEPAQEGGVCADDCALIEGFESTVEQHLGCVIDWDPVAGH
jgi:hypothetical protein